MVELTTIEWEELLLDYNNYLRNKYGRLPILFDTTWVNDRAERVLFFRGMKYTEIKRG